MDGLKDSTQSKRIDAKAFLLTYSQTKLTKEVVYIFLSGRPDVLRLIVGMEPHQDGNPHIHAYVVYNKSRDCGYKSFDIQGEHPNIQTHKPCMDPAVSMVNAWGYCRKHDLDPMIVGSPPPEPPPRMPKRSRDGDNSEPPVKKQKKDDLIRECVAIACDPNRRLKDAYDHLMDRAPSLAFEKATCYKTGFQQKRAEVLGDHPIVYSLDDFPLAPPLPPNWRCLFISGPTNCGKTAWAKALLPNAQVVSHRDQLKDGDVTEGVIFDDYETLHWPACHVIHLLDWDQPRGTDVKHSHVVIPCHTRKIFTFNGTFEEWAGGSVKKDPKDKWHGNKPYSKTEYEGSLHPSQGILPSEKYPRTQDQIAAMRRRVHVVNVRLPLYVPRVRHAGETPEEDSVAPESEPEEEEFPEPHYSDVDE